MFKDEVDPYFAPGEQVAYAPLNEVTQLKQQIVQYGFVTSTRINGDDTMVVFCRFWNADRMTLRTTTTSERCDWYDLVHCSVVPTVRVDSAWRQYVAPDILPSALGYFDAGGANCMPAVGVACTVKYALEWYPAVVSNVTLVRRSAASGKICRLPVAIEIAYLNENKLIADQDVHNLHASSSAPPYYNHRCTDAQIAKYLRKRTKSVLEFNKRKGFWTVHGAEVVFGDAVYKRDFAV